MPSRVDTIRDSARKEFEAARHESDPELVLRILMTLSESHTHAADVDGRDGPSA